MCVSVWAGVCVLSCSVAVSDPETPWTVAHQAPLSMGFSRQEYWGRPPFPPPGDLPDREIKHMSPASSALAGRFINSLGSLTSQTPLPDSAPYVSKFILPNGASPAQRL